MGSASFHLPLFPLGVFLLPGERTGLHIFEARYRQLVTELETAMANGREEGNRFGIPFFHEDITAATGTIARLVEVKKTHANGRKDIVVEGVGHFETQRFESIANPKLYPGGHVIRKDIQLGTPLEPQHRAQVLRIKEILSAREVDLDRLRGETIEDLTGWLGLPPAHKHRLLTTSGSQRSEFLSSILRWTLLILQQESKVEKGFFPN